jgi:hypothetical protein
MMETGEEPEQGVSLLSRTVQCEGHELHIHIYADDEGEWILEVVNERGDITGWTYPFRTERGALREALKAIREEGLQEFLSDPPWRQPMT